ncbi:uncharacterized protein [Arachis hypogaea]|uniref:uncharacterized protein n=1 Tax=Arachis hypogaea TaxID=3818 RepID=UPI003B21465B
MYGTSLLINPDVPEVVMLQKREISQYLSVLSVKPAYVNEDEVLYSTERKTTKELRAAADVGFNVVLATILDVEPVLSWWYKLNLLVFYGTATTTFVVFDKEAAALFGRTCTEMVKELNGQNYHRLGSLLPPDSLRPTFAQLYIYDIENDIDNRIGTLRFNKTINEQDKKIVAILRNMLDKYNSLAKSFYYARDRYQQKNCTNIKLMLINKKTTDGRTYNLPSASEVATLIVGDVEQLNKDRDIIIKSQTRKLQQIDVFHLSYLALQYPLLFSYGKDGFRLGIATSDSISARPTKKNKTITLRQFFAFQLCTEKDGLINEDVDATRLGKRIIIPSAFTGGPRYAGYPSYFITMTCNPEWNEIKREVTPIGLKAKDRADILCQVFKIKLDGLIDDLKEKKIFGKILGYVCTIEFQKRGLPHTHILLFMSNEFKPQTPDDIDKHITTEIPDENERPNLHGTVQNYMVHGPCELLLKFGCHINMEYTCQTSSIMYLFKYVHKGNDRVTTTLYNTGDPSEATQVVEEIRNYYDCRPEHVWDRCWHELSDDILYRQRTMMNMRELTMLDDEINQLCLIDIDKILHFYGKTMKDYLPMPLATEVDSSLLTERVIREELNFNRDDLKKNSSDMLAIAIPEQKYAFDKIVTAVYCDEGIFSVYGHESTGKIFLWNLISAEIRS